MKTLKPSFLPGIVWFIISTVLLTLPGSSFPKEDWLSKIWFDKWVHIGMFALMVYLWCWSLLKIQSNAEKLKRGFIGFLFLWFAYGVSMEFVQKYLIVNRSFDTGDIVADAIGCVIGFLFSWSRYIKKN